MKRLTTLLMIVIIFLVPNCKTLDVKSYDTGYKTDAGGYKYEYVKNDPYKARIYTLKNGLKIYLSVNNDKPRIQTYIAVKAGSKFDPVDTTGLAHYLEHMLFKGTSRLGTTDWAKEKPLLDRISALYEEHKKADTPEQKKAVYAKIDRLSQEASAYAAPNEYDKITRLIGAQEVNAHTSNEETVYKADIPAGELERWLILERERFNELVLRLFHTELESVYEEFNGRQDNMYARLYTTMLGALFPNHPYGSQTTIGKAAHLKNPSMVNIHKYFNTYYVPNNMAICLSGDIDPEQTVKLIDKYWGDMKPNDTLPVFTPPAEEPITEPIVREIYSPEAPIVNIAFRLAGANSADEKIVTLLDMVLSNQSAGLIDLNLVQQQKVLGAYSHPRFMKDYGFLMLSGMPKEGQDLAEVKDLLLAQIDEIKAGNFEEWLLDAVINDMKLYRIKQMDSNKSRANIFVDQFITNAVWADSLAFLDELKKISRADIMAFAQKHLNDNYVVVYKQQGTPQDMVKVEKPDITPIAINREVQSVFFTDFTALSSMNVDPVFIDFKKEIKTDYLKNGLELNYIQNTTNDLFKLHFIIDMAGDHDKKLPLAATYFPYLATTRYTPAELQKELYKQGLETDFEQKNDRTYLSLSGLDQSFEGGVSLFEHMIADVKPDDNTYRMLVSSLLKQRQNAKQDKDSILYQAMLSYAKYGDTSSFTNRLSEEELLNLNPVELTDLVKSLLRYKHTIFYYGPRKLTEVKKILEASHYTGTEFIPLPEKQEYTELPTDKPVVYFVDYDSVQAEVVLLAKDLPFSLDILTEAWLFNEYYGSGLSSIFFQEIRESKGLAYSAYSFFSIPRLKEKSHYLYAFIGTQPDKLSAVLDSSLSLLNTMPRAKQQFIGAKQAILMNIENERIIKDNIYWTAMRYHDRGIDYDYRKDIYDKVRSLTFDDFERFFTEHIKGKQFTLLILGDKSRVDMSLLNDYATVQELSIEQIFGY